MKSFFFILTSPCFADLIDSVEIAESTLDDNSVPRSGVMVPFTLKKSQVLVTGEQGIVIDETSEATETRYIPIEYACPESIEKILYELNNNMPRTKSHGYMYWENVCSICQQNPCVVVEHLSYIHEIAMHLRNKGESNRAIRYQLYRRLSNKLHGPLGRGNRVPLPDCLVDFVRENFPNENTAEQYVGFRPAPTDGDA